MNITKRNNLYEIIIFIVFCISVIALSLFHEPWYDELQAWAISKDTIYNILFVIPHYEGHPPLWYLLLKPFTRMNLFPDIGLKFVNLGFMIAAVWLLIFKSKFPAPVRFLLPFTYFIFYQYSVINRPYCIYCLSLFLIADAYKSKNEHPYKFSALLALLSLSCVFGMAVAFGFSVVWIIELIKNKTSWHSKSYISLFILFIFACLIMLLIMPKENSYALNNFYAQDKVLQILYSIFILPADALFFDLFSYGNASLFYIDFSYLFQHINNPKLCYIKTLFFAGFFIGCIINVFLVCLFRQLKSILIFLIPFLSFILISCIYIAPHHIGLMTILLISVFWIVFSANTIYLNDNYKKLLIFFMVLTIAMQIYWSISAGIRDFKYDYFPHKAEYMFLKQYNLENYKIMSAYNETDPVFVHKKTRKIYFGDKIKTYNDILNLSQDYEFKIKRDLNIQWPALCIGQYYNKNIFYNFNIDNNKPYVINKYLSEEEKINTIEQWQKLGLPDIIVGRPNIDFIFKNEDSPSKKYILWKIFYYGMIWKDKYYPVGEEIYILKDLKI